MGNTWDKFAEENAEFYILTGDTDYTTEKGKKYFFESGEEFTGQTLEEVSHLLPGKERALEIGCGIGRLTLPHSNIFEEVVAVDLSSVMLDKLSKNTVEFDKNNIETFLPSGEWDEYSFDYAYSFLVFQHIENLSTIENYIKRISLSLKSGGIAQLHFDTRPPSILYRVRNILPDVILPNTQRKGVRRIRRQPAALEKIFEKYSLKIIQQVLPNTKKHTFILNKS